MGKRFLELDVARGFAATAVIIIHVATLPLMDNCKAGAFTFACIALVAVSRFAVALFVLISGIGLALSGKHQEGYFKFVGRRIGKVAPAYIVWSLIYSLIYQKKHGIAFSYNTQISEIAHNLLTGTACYHLYFVPLIIELYLLFPLLYKIIRTQTGLVISSLLSIGLALAYPKLQPLVHMGFVYHLGSTASWMLFFAAGIWLADPRILAALKTEQYKPWLRGSLILLIIGMVSIIYRRAVLTNSYNEIVRLIKIFVIPYTLLFIAWVFNEDWQHKILTPFLKLMAKYSYGVYLSHVLVFTVFGRIYMTPERGYGPTYLILGFIITMGGTLGMNIIGGYLKNILAGSIIHRPAKSAA